jgi:hypothetical protein
MAIGPSIVRNKLRSNNSSTYWAKTGTDYGQGCQHANNFNVKITYSEKDDIRCSNSSNERVIRDHTCRNTWASHIVTKLDRSYLPASAL